MSYHPGVCYWPVGFDYSPEGIAKIPVGTVRKFGNTGWDERFYWNEGDRVRAMQAQGKRVLGTFTVGDNSQWATMADADWQRKIGLYMENLSIRGVEVGNEIGAREVPAYLPKLRIASDIIRSHGGWVMLSSPFPGTEVRVWDALHAAGGFDFCDGVACHPYAKTPADSLSKVQTFRSRLRGYGGRAAKLGLHLTEFGWATAPSTAYYYVSEAVQAQYVAEAFRLFKANASALNLHNCWYYTFNDGYGPDYGVVRADGTHKPAYDALAAV